MTQVICLICYKSIRYREYAKFIFTKNISNILKLVEEFAEINQLNLDLISHVPISEIIKHETCADVLQIKSDLEQLALINSKKNILSSNVNLPYLIKSEKDFSVIPILKSQPNYITNKSCSGQTYFLDKINLLNFKRELNDRIILIESADPGYDWIFLYKIKGLITKYGGSNSHMAIRCAEMSIPAAIGCGDKSLQELKKAKFIKIDTINKNIIPY